MSSPGVSGAHPPTGGINLSGLGIQRTQEEEKTEDVNLALAQEVSDAEDALFSEETANPVMAEKKLSKVDKKDDKKVDSAKGDKSESVLVRIEADAGEEFAKFKDQNKYVKFPDEKLFKKLAVDLETKFTEKSSPQEILEYIEASLKDADPVLIAKTIEFLAIHLTNRVEKETNPAIKEILQAKLRNLLVASDTFHARPGVKAALDGIDSKVLEVSARAVEFHEEAILRKTADSLLLGVSAIVAKFSKETEKGALNKEAMELREAKAIIAEIAPKATDKAKTTILKEFKILHDIAAEKMKNPRTPPEEVANLKNLRGKLVKAEEVFLADKNIQAALKKEADLSGMQRNMLDEIRTIGKKVLEEPTQTVHEKFKALIVDPNWHKKLKETTKPQYKALGRAIASLPNLEMENHPVMSKIIGELVVVRAIKHTPDLVEKGLRYHTGRLIQLEVISGTEAA